MLVVVVPTRSRGVLLERRHLVRAAGVYGDLRVVEMRDERLRRTLRVAQVFDRRRPAKGELLPPLLDAQLLWMSSSGFTLGGFERLGVSGECTEFAQAWWCRMPFA